MKIGDVYEITPMVRLAFGSIHAGPFYGKFIGRDSADKCVFDVDGKYVGYFEAASGRNLFESARIEPLKEAL
jgi:hypothetical protein